MTDRDYRAALEKAAERASETYGPRYARRALEDAIHYQRGARCDARKSAENRLLARMAMGDETTEEDVRDVDRMMEIDRIGRELDFAPRPTPAPSRPEIWGGASQPTVSQTPQPTERHIRALVQNLSKPSALRAFEDEFGKGSAMKAVQGLADIVSTKDLGYRCTPARQRAKLEDHMDPPHVLLQRLFGGG